jgi:hypothetical protein
MTPNDIIAALLDVASAAYGMSTMRSNRTECAEFENKLETALDELNKLPQPADHPPLTPSAKARYYMQEFLGGRPIEINGKEFSAAFWLQSLGEPVPPLQPGPALREFDWFDFLAYRARMLDIFHDEGKSDAEIAETMSMDKFQVALIRTRTRGLVPNRGPHKPITDTITLAQCMEPAGPTAADKARETMKQTLIELKEQTDATTAKRIIAKVGGVQFMADIPDKLVNAVTIAARDRMALDRRLAELRAAGDFAGVESLLRGTEEKPAYHTGGVVPAGAPMPVLPRELTVHDHFDVPMDPESKDGKDTIAAMHHYVATGELPKQDDQVQGQGGTFDGGGASGDFQ